MYSYQIASWVVILGISCMSLGGLVLWAYGARAAKAGLAHDGVEAAATIRFHTRLTRWFFIYGICLIAGGAAVLMWSMAILFNK